jgi:hypothetical protein
VSLPVKLASVMNALKTIKMKKDPYKAMQGSSLTQWAKSAGVGVDFS